MFCSQLFFLIPPFTLCFCYCGIIDDIVLYFLCLVVDDDDFLVWSLFCYFFVYEVNC